MPGESDGQLPPERSEKYIAQAAPTLFQDLADDGSADEGSAKKESTESADVAQSGQSDPVEKPPVKVHKDNAVRKAAAWSKLNPFKKKP